MNEFPRRARGAPRIIEGIMWRRLVFTLRALYRRRSGPFDLVIYRR